MNLNQNIIKKTYIFFISFLFIFFSCNSDDDNKGVTPADDTNKDAFVAVTGVTLDKEEFSLEVGSRKYFNSDCYSSNCDKQRSELG